jgi:hypothetical protein
MDHGELHDGGGVVKCPDCKPEPDPKLSADLIGKCGFAENRLIRNQTDIFEKMADDEEKWPKWDAKTYHDASIKQLVEQHNSSVGRLVDRHNDEIDKDSFESANLRIQLSRKEREIRKLKIQKTGLLNVAKTLLFAIKKMNPHHSWINGAEIRIKRYGGE